MKLLKIDIDRIQNPFLKKLLEEQVMYFLNQEDDVCHTMITDEDIDRIAKNYVKLAKGEK